MKNIFKITIFSFFLVFSTNNFFSLQANDGVSVEKYEKKLEERVGLGFIFSLPSNLSTEMSFSPEFSKENSKLRLSMMHSLSAVHETKKLILEDKVKLVVLIGSCYSKLPGINYGDLVYVDGYILPQKERIFMQNSQIKSLNQVFQLKDKEQDLSDRVENFLEKQSENLSNLFKKYHFQTSSNNKLVSGLIFSGDAFFISETYFKEFKNQYPSLIAGDIEGAAVAKICKKYNIPLLSIKMIFPEVNPKEDSLKTWVSLHKEIVEIFFKEFIQNLSKFFSENP